MPFTNEKGNHRPGKRIQDGNYKKNCTNNCKRQCNTHISHAERGLIHNSFYNATKVEKTHIIINNTKSKPKTFFAVASRKKMNFEYYLTERRVRVCKPFFLGTLNVSAGQVYLLNKNKDRVTGLPKPSGQGKNTKSRIADEDRKNVLRHIRSFPSVESHYGRGESTKSYLGIHLNV